MGNIEKVAMLCAAHGGMHLGDVRDVMPDNADQRKDNLGPMKTGSIRLTER